MSPPPPPPTRTASGSPSDDPDPKPRKDPNQAWTRTRPRSSGSSSPTPTSNPIFVFGYKERRWDLKQLIGSGGMPSSHSATVTSLATAVGFHDDFGGSPFATALVLACVVLNQIVYELPVKHPLAESKPLRELLWHTPTQVIAGSFLGLVTVIVGHFIVASGTAQD